MPYQASLSEVVSDLVRAAVGVQTVALRSGLVGVGGGCQSDGLAGERCLSN
jgi:hypothetical protein